MKLLSRKRRRKTARQFSRNQAATFLALEKAIQDLNQTGMDAKPRLIIHFPER